MRHVFSDEFRTACYLEIEAALARVQGRIGIIPQHAADEIVSKCRVENIDFAKLKRQTERIGYPILGVVQQIVALCDKGLGEWCHWGATTQDITDTATIMQIRAALDLVERRHGEDRRRARRPCAALSRHADGRAQQPAAGGAAHLRLQVRARCSPRCSATAQRLKELRPRVLVGEFAGAVGTLSSLGADGLKVQEALMPKLKLGQPEIAWHTVRDRIGEVGCFLGLVTGTLGKISMDVKLLMQTEVAEVFEPFHEGRGSSSTMPQKRNPDRRRSISTRPPRWCASNAAALLEAAVADHERSTGPWEIEWIALPEIFLLSSGALAQTRVMVAGLQVDAARMRANLDLTYGMIVSEAVMMGLGPHLGRQRAHDLVYDICREVVANGTPLVDLLAQDTEITKHLKRADLEKLCDPANYLGLAGEMVDRVLAAESKTVASPRLR